MGSVKVTVYGRVKPCPRNLHSREYRLRSGENEDYITFTSSKVLSGKKSFRFRKIFNEQATQEEVFEAVAKPVIEKVLSGYNGTIFTYGQTGSGKTYTMTGDIEKWVHPGLIPRTIQRIFQLKRKDVSVSITYCEIYNEHVYDLIRSDRMESDLAHISVMEDSSGITCLRNLSVHIVNTAYEAIQLLIRGDANKMVAETSSNAKSSRSHVLFSISLQLPHPSQEKYYVKPVLYLVDLAGSEKLSKCKTQMSNPWETRYINLSLHYLEQVLLALRQPGRIHIPYRNSLMTALLRNSLGGNCITSMIATFSVSVDDLDETVQTCRFSERIALIKNEVKMNEELNPVKEIEELRKENKRLKSQIKLLGGLVPAQELSDEDKEKCADLIQKFIEKNALEDLPFSDLKRMEYCLYLMREEIIGRPKEDENKKSESTFEFLKNCSAITANILEVESKSIFSPSLTKRDERLWKKKKNPINLPKVNISYEGWTLNDAEPGKNELKAIKNEEEFEKNLALYQANDFLSGSGNSSDENLPGPSVNRIADPESFILAKCFLNETEEESHTKPYQASVGLQHASNENNYNEDVEVSSSVVEAVSSPSSGTTFKIEMMDNDKSTGELTWQCQQRIIPSDHSYLSITETILIKFNPDFLLSQSHLSSPQNSASYDSPWAFKSLLFQGLNIDTISRDARPKTTACCTGSDDQLMQVPSRNNQSIFSLHLKRAFSKIFLGKFL